VKVLIFLTYKELSNYLEKDKHPDGEMDKEHAEATYQKKIASSQKIHEKAESELHLNAKNSDKTAIQCHSFPIR
jgi:hypothetical protein